MRAAALTLLTAAAAHLCACVSPRPHSLTLVESSPVEAGLASPDLPSTATVWVELLEAAQDRVDLCQFYASDEPPSQLGPVLAALEAAARRGVRVRLLLSEAFRKTYPEIGARVATWPEAEVAWLDLEPISGGIHHAKYLVVDRSAAYLGSANLDWRALEHIVELGVRIDDEGFAGEVAALFEHDWHLATAPLGLEAPRPARRKPHTLTLHPEQGAAGPVEARLVTSPTTLLGREREDELGHLLELIEGARADLRATTLTLRLVDREGRPFQALREALARAAARGVRVRLLVSDWNTRPWLIGGVQDLARIEGLEVAFLVIPEARSGHIPFARTLHAKTFVADDQVAWIGSSNLEESYFTRSRNVGVVLSGAPAATRLAAWFDDLWSSPFTVVVDPDAEYPVRRVD